jgi:hypothetical protein
MNMDELKHYIGITGHSLGQVEKDYLQHIILGALSRNMGGEITFKGGTALQKTGFVTRFSEDLDFTATKPQTMARLSSAVASTLDAYNYSSKIDQIMDDDRTIGFRIMIQGPLYKGPESLSSVRIEISKRESVLQEPDRKEIAPPYADILPYILEVMNLEEIASEKVRAILTRSKARDLYDLHMLMLKGKKPNIDMVNQKLLYYDLEFNLENFMKQCKLLEKKWDSEMAQLVGETPPFRTVYGFVINALR